MITFSGAKGHHLHVFSQDWLPARTMRRLLEIVRELAGLPEDVEVFPKQDVLEVHPQTGEIGLGNLVKLPLARHPETSKIAEILDPPPGRQVVPVPAALLEQIVAGHSDVGQPPAAEPRSATEGSGGRPGDDFNERADWASDVLEPAGWERTGRDSRGDLWLRNRGGRKGWHSARLYAPDGPLFCWSPNAGLPVRKGLSKFNVYALLQHDGDFSAAAAELKRQGYGAQIPRLSLVTKGAAPSADHDRESKNGAQSDVQIVTITRSAAGVPEPLGEDAFYGLPSLVCDLVRPFAESDKVAILSQFLAAYGVAVGIRPHFFVGATRHTPALFLTIIGRTSRARKGTSWDPLEALLTRADPSFKDRIFDGVGSGEALTHLVRDPRIDKNGEVVDEGARDKRLLLQAGELAQILVTVNREGSTMSSTLRNAFDGRPLRNLVKTNPAESTVYHLGLIGQSTVTELRNKLTEEQVRNGLGNRILYVFSHRDQRIARPPAFEGAYVDEMVEILRQRLREASAIRTMRWSAEAASLWDGWYLKLPDDTPGTIGALTDRAEAHVLRIAMVYALTDASATIGVEHLKAALALWDYCRRSAGHIFGGATGDAIADRILTELSFGPVTRREIWEDVFQRNVTAAQLEKAARILESDGRIIRECVKTPGRGRDPERWRLL